MNQVELNFNNLIEQIPGLVADEMLTIGLDAKAMIQQRIQENGVDADGHITPEYSDSYFALRKRKGKQTSFMDLTYTGEMWRSIGPVHKGSLFGAEIVTIAGRDEETQNKINWNSEKKFEVLKLSKEEEEDLQAIFSENLGKKVVDILSQGL